MSWIKIAYAPQLEDPRAEQVVEHLQHEDAPIQAELLTSWLSAGDLQKQKWARAAGLGWAAEEPGAAESVELYRFGAVFELCELLVRGWYSAVKSPGVYFAPSAGAVELEWARVRAEEAGLRVAELSLAANWLELELPPGAGSTAVLKSVLGRIRALEDFDVLLLDMSVDAFVEDSGSLIEAERETFVLIAQAVAALLWEKDAMLFAVGGRGDAEGDGTAWIWGSMLDMISGALVLRNFT